MTYLDNPVEWVSFIDDAGTNWMFDLTFLTSGWHCTFGSTCKGTEPDDNGARGCCAHGAHLVDDDEATLISEYAARLDSSIWQNADLVTSDDDLFDEVEGDKTTGRVDDACIFLNDPSFKGGHGCALHIGALRASERPLDWKPAVCWQVPFRLEEIDDASGTTNVMVRAWRRSDWGGGGADFGWWCTEELAAPEHGRQTWQTHIDELTELVGEEPVAWLRDYLEQRRRGTPVQLS